MSASTKRRSQVSPSLRFRVFERDHFKCRYCGCHGDVSLLQVDHINPVANGGDNRLDNLVTACWECNIGKRDRILRATPRTITVPRHAPDTKAMALLSKAINQGTSLLELVDILRAKLAVCKSQNARLMSLVEDYQSREVAR